MDKQEFDIAFKQILLETFKFTIDFLESHELKWWACGGTMLGAIRHHDIIPWDDDIDIMMPRNDYNRLIDLSKDLVGTNYRFICPRDEDYYLPSAKIYDTSTTIIESKRYPFPIGVFVDIFPLDQFDYSIEEYKAKFKKYNRVASRFKLGMARYSISEAISDIKTKHLGSLFYGMKSLLFPYRKREKYRASFLGIEQMFNNAKGRNIASPTGAYGTKEFFRSEWFDETIECAFNDFSVKVPVGFKQYLTVMYGDYMKLPPEDKRVSHHCFYYIDLYK